MNNKNIICSAHQPAFLPWLGLIHKIIVSDTFVFMDIAKFRKRAFMHRNKIEINNSSHYLGLKLDDSSDKLFCDEIKISKHNLNCLTEVAKKLDHTYKKSKFKNEIDEFISNTILDIKFDTLNSIFFNQIIYICKKLKVTTNIIKESEILSKEEAIELGASHRLLAHAKKTNAKIYMTGINSINYLDTKIFKKNFIEHVVQKFDYNIFKKYQNTTEPLSFVHQLAFLGFEQLGNILKQKQINKEKIINSILKND